jgi:DNA helicase-2/ATP-dependent DNA helicase PcrA
VGYEAALLLAERERAAVVRRRVARAPVGLAAGTAAPRPGAARAVAAPSAAGEAAAAGAPRHRVPPWLEERYGAARLLDIDELPGAADDGAAPDAELSALQEAFLASEWAARSPVAVEVPFSAVVAGVVVRGRMDAVFAHDSSYEVVDWKTVRRRPPRPRPPPWRCSWRRTGSRGHGWPESGSTTCRRRSSTSATAATVRPADLLDEAQLVELITRLPSA